jgi:hypothetical protein
LFRGTASATPGAPVSNGEAKFNFYNVHFPNITIGQGRSNINTKLLFQECIIKYEEQPFGEDCGDQRYVNCDITCTNASSKYLVTVGSGNNCELIDCTLRNIELPFRYFATYPATGTITFGGNKLLGTSSYSASNLLTNMSWTTTGYTEVPLLRTNDGSPADGTLVYINSDTTSDPIKRKRVSGVWVDTYASKLFISEASDFTIVAGEFYQIDGSAGAINAALPATLVDGQVITVHNETISTNPVLIKNPSFTIKGSTGTIAAGTDLSLAAGDTAKLVAQSTTILGVV